MLNLRKSRYYVRFAQTDEDVRSAQKLRSLAFFGDENRLDIDDFDSICSHILIGDQITGVLVCCVRLHNFEKGQEIDQSYSAQFYDLSLLQHYHGRMLEMGRFCIHPEWKDPDILRIAWGALTQYVDDNKIEILFGCSSFNGSNWKDHYDALALLKYRHLASQDMMPKIKSNDIFEYAAHLQGKPDAKKAALGMPPLLKTYLMMGGWVSDHAVIDRQLNTLHVFTGVEICKIPAARKRILRAVFA